tara:strand:- start:66 stop:434 length:369 start_codon:yes stop_codon:yes gene_type:complete
MSAKRLDEMAHMITRKEPDMGEGQRALTLEENNKIMNQILKEVDQVKHGLFVLVQTNDEREKKAILAMLKSKLDSDNIPKSLKETIRNLLVLHKNKDKLRGGKKTKRRGKKRKRRKSKKKLK